MGLEGEENNCSILGCAVDSVAASLPDVPPQVVNFAAGVGDALLVGTGPAIRETLGIDGGVDTKSTAYDLGSAASLVVGTGRLAYAAVAKVGSLLAPTGAAASLFRQELKDAFRLGMAKDWRPPNLLGKTDEALRASAGRTNPGINMYGAGVAGGAAYQLCTSKCFKSDKE